MDQDLIRVLEKISNALEENTTILNDQSFGQQVRDIFRPQEN